MSIEFRRGGDVFNDGASVVVVAVNALGVAGAGQALAAKQRWPWWFDEYRNMCLRGRFSGGSVTPHKVLRPGPGDPSYVVSFATKHDWRFRSRLEWIEIGMYRLVAWANDDMPRTGHDVIGLPAIGCGLGGCLWADVKPRIESACRALRPEVSMVVYEPGRL